ncbi:MAG: GDP-mannose 4,6-dehydratase [Candidatus Komeilibacteria bacterium]|nr:GDP-mannose 4,6-dehydratase [Candidatus Komeilibacteria bacterium]
MKILVTGGAGFIGSNLCERLLKEKHEVICLDNFNDYYSPIVKKNNIASFLNNPDFELATEDILNKAGLEKIFTQHKIDTVIHLAAKAGVRASLIDPEGFSVNNIIGTFNVLEACQKHGIKNLIFGSSSSVYGNNTKVPFAETDNVDYPISPYAATKKACELFCFNYHHLYHLNVICLRFFTVYGPNNRPDMAHFKMLDSIINGQPITKYGDGESRRDYTFVDDIVDGIIACLNKNLGFEIINLGGSQTITLNRMIEVLEKTTGKKAIIENLPFPPGDVNQTYADISKAKSLLGWEPKTLYQEGVKKLFDWYQKKLTHI